VFVLKTSVLHEVELFAVFSLIVNILYCFFGYMHAYCVLFNGMIAFSLTRLAVYLLCEQKRKNFSVFLEALILLRSTLKYLSLCFLRNAELSYIVPTRRVSRLHQGMHM
jgi:hypothetical protein